MMDKIITQDNLLGKAKALNPAELINTKVSINLFKWIEDYVYIKE